MKKPRTQSICPFCTSVSFSVTYISITTEPIASKEEKGIKTSTIPNSKDEKKSTQNYIGNKNTNSIFSTPSPRKRDNNLSGLSSTKSVNSSISGSLESISADVGQHETPSAKDESNPSSVKTATSVVSVEARKALERQMMTQRDSSPSSDTFPSSTSNRHSFGGNSYSRTVRDPLIQHPRLRSESQPSNINSNNSSPGDVFRVVRRRTLAQQQSPDTLLSLLSPNHDHSNDNHSEEFYGRNNNNISNSSMSTAMTRELLMRRELSEMGFGQSDGFSTRRRLSDLAQIEEMMLREVSILT